MRWFFHSVSQYASRSLHVEHHQSGISEEVLRLIIERYEAQLAELRAINERLLKVVERLVA
jgi:hypothetical protein